MYQPMAPCRPPSRKRAISRGVRSRGMRRVHQDQTKGTKNTMPMIRPRNRCPHSHQKMALKASRLMPRLTMWYSGICLYFSKASCQAASVKGGMMPTIGFHSVIDKPESVRRVAPPTTTIRNTIAVSA
jgi:hypothetical protein